MIRVVVGVVKVQEKNTKVALSIFMVVLYSRTEQNSTFLNKFIFWSKNSL